MDTAELTGYYTYRSFRNLERPAGDFNTLRFGEGELLLFVGGDGTISGSLAFPADAAAPEKNLMDIEGAVTSWEPFTFQFTGVGRANTAISDFQYSYEGEAAPRFEAATDQKFALSGTVIRDKDHGSGAQLAKAGETASFVAVRRPFVEPREVPGVGLIEPAKAMLASRSHRMHHLVWHLLRSMWWGPLIQTDRDAVAALNWKLERPPFRETGGIDLANGAGEDFLFMHRRMIAMVAGVYAANGAAPPVGWTAIPPAGAPQFAYAETDAAGSPAMKTFVYDAGNSGAMVPPAAGVFAKTPDFLNNVMRPQARQFRGERYLASLSLGALGNLVEFTIHNWMHNRWAAPSRDPLSGALAERDVFDLSPKWEDPRYDYLGEFYSSQVNPVFWRLHGWVDDTIEAWFAAQEAARPGAVERRRHKGVNWFGTGELVVADKPFDNPEWWDAGGHAGHGDHDHDQAKIVEMEKVIAVLRAASERSAVVAEAGAGPRDTWLVPFPMDAIRE